MGVNKKKILMFLQDGVGGAERITTLIGKNIDIERYDVCFCLIERNSNSNISDFIPKEMNVKRISNKNPFLLMWNIVTLILKEKPYVVFSSVINISNKFLPFRWLFPKTKVIIRCDNYLYTYTKKQNIMIATLYPKADCIIAQTEEMKDELVRIGVNEKKIHVLHNPIDKQTIDKKVVLQTSPYPNNGRKHYVAVGRFNQQKGFDLLIDAFVEIHKNRNDVDLYIVGDNTLGGGTIYREIENKAKQYGIGGVIYCVGYKDNPYVYIKYADCFVLSSRWEGLPNVLIEALYLGTPVAAFKCIPIIERIITEGKDGYLAEKEDVKSLSNAMEKAVEMGRVTTNYKSATISEFTELFK